MIDICSILLKKEVNTGIANITSTICIFPHKCYISTLLKTVWEP